MGRLSAWTGRCGSRRSNISQTFLGALLRGLIPAVVLSCAVAAQLAVPGVPFPLVPSSAGLWRVDEAVGTVQVSAQPHTDIFMRRDLRRGPIPVRAPRPFPRRLLTRPVQRLHSAPGDGSSPLVAAVNWSSACW